jgi:hypothetical protein
MALDPRLASAELLVLAAMRAKQRQGSQADPFAVTWLGMDGEPEDPDAAHSPSGIYLPRECASAEEWVNSPLMQGSRAKLQAVGGRTC